MCDQQTQASLVDQQVKAQMTTKFSADGWRSNSTEGSCVEVNHHPNGFVALRDSADCGEGPVLVFGPLEWAAFVRGVRDRTLTP